MQSEFCCVHLHLDNDPHPDQHAEAGRKTSCSDPPLVVGLGLRFGVNYVTIHLNCWFRVRVRQISCSNPPCSLQSSMACGLAFGMSRHRPYSSTGQCTARSYDIYYLLQHTLHRYCTLQGCKSNVYSGGFSNPLIIAPGLLYVLYRT